MMRPLEVLPANTGGTPNCANVSVSTGPSKIIVNGLAGAPVSQLQVFNSAWQPFFSCYADCGASKTVTAPPGTYYVKVKYFSASYQLICEVNKTVTVSQFLTGMPGEVFELDASKNFDIAQVIWTHNVGHMVQRYELERSTDGTLFETIKTELPKGEYSTELYNCLDLAPAVGDNFYRVKALLTDGTYGYSTTKMVHFDDMLDFSLFPNPANSTVNINLESVMDAEDVSIQVFNTIGVLVKRFDFEKVETRYNNLDIRDLHEGHYIVWLNVPGKRAVARTLVVGKY
jgi:Secretion system C-terminal sorting domain